MSFFPRAGRAARAAGLACLVISAPCQAANDAPERLTLGQALDRALGQSPTLDAQRAVLERAAGRLATARTYPFNPRISFEANRREGDGTATDRELRIGQEVEIGGQRRRRVTEAGAELDVSRAALTREERLLAARVRAAFVDALRIRELRDVESSNAELVESLAEFARKRLESGAAAQMEVNLAQVQVGRAERDLALVVGEYEVARSLLAELVGLDPSQPPEPVGELDVALRPLPQLSELLGGALERRADLISFRESTTAARVRIERSRRERIPNLELEGFYGREDGSDRLVGGALALRIPIFNRNQGRIAEARATHREALAKTAAAELRIRREVTASLARHRATRVAREQLQQRVISTLEENLRLLQRSFEAGKTGWSEVLVFRREFVDAQRDYIETVAEARLAAIELDLACGVQP